MAFSRSLKRMLGVPLSTSNHAVAEIFDQLLFIHYVTVVQTRYFKRVFNSNNPLISISSFTLRNGFLFQNLFQRLNNSYNVGFSMHTLDILRARVGWVQRHEPTTGQLLWGFIYFVSRWYYHIIIIISLFIQRFLSRFSY